MQNLKIQLLRVVKFVIGPGSEVSAPSVEQRVCADEVRLLWATLYDLGLVLKNKPVNGEY